MIYPFNAGEVFKIALNIEDNGYLFYQKAAAKPFPNEVRKLFEELSEEERQHKRIFSELMVGLPPAATGDTVWDPDNETDQYLKMMADQHVFQADPKLLEEKTDRISTPVDAVKMAMSFEKDTIVLFVELLSLSEGLESQNAIKKLVMEEQRHLKKLIGILRTLK